MALIIRRQQKEALGLAARDAYLGRVTAHARRHFPEECAKMTSGELRDCVRLAIEKAERHDFRSERDVCKFVNLVFAFGPEFDGDPGQPWAREILGNGHGAPSMGLLYARAIENAHLGQGIHGNGTGPRGNSNARD